MGPMVVHVRNKEVKHSMSVLESPGICRQQNRFPLDSLKGRDTADLCHMYASGQWDGLGYTSEQHVQGPC